MASSLRRSASLATSIRILAAFGILSSVGFVFAKPQPKYIKPDNFDLKTILGEPPKDDSPEHRAEVDKLLKYQADRTPEDVARCKSEVEDSTFLYASVLGEWFNAKDLPVTAAFLKQVYADTKSVSAEAKQIWSRVRPPLADDRIKPCVPLENTGSFPSGHATRAVVISTVLAEMFPEFKEKLLARGKQVGEDRVVAGMHYPTDVVAGQKLGAAIAKQLLANPEFKADLEKARDECLIGSHK